MIIRTPIKQVTKPKILLKLIFSLKNKIERSIIKIGEEVYIIPIFAIVVDIPAIKGKAPQIPQPIRPKKDNSNKGDIFINCRSCAEYIRGDWRSSFDGRYCKNCL